MISNLLEEPMIDFIKTLWPRRQPAPALPKHNLFCECRRCNPSAARYMRELKKAFRDEQ